MFIVSTLRSRLLLFSFLLIAGSLPAQVKFTTVCRNQQVGEHDIFEVEFVVDNARRIDDLTQPVFRDFNVVKGPDVSSGMTIVNGAISQHRSLSFVLQPTRKGRLVIPGATAVVDGKTIRSNDITIRVVSGSVVKAPVARPFAWPGEDPMMMRDYYLKPGENINDKIRKNLFVKVQVSKTSCYVGEPIVATYKLYSRLQSESRVVKHPSLNGFSVYDMVDPSADNSLMEKVDGREFTVHIIRKTQLIPLQPGTIQLDPVQIDNTIHFIKGTGQAGRSSNPLQELFDRLSDDAMGDGVPVQQEVSLQTKPVAIDVKPLPAENRPANFAGAVGDFHIEASVDDRATLSADDAATLKVNIAGSGNLPMVNAPAVNWPHGLESYSANTNETVDKTVAPMTGNKTFAYKFVLSSAGKYVIPAVGFSYFDPAKKTYRSIATDSIVLAVVPADKKRTEPPATAVVSAGDTESFFAKHLEWFLGGLILSALAVYLFLQNRKISKVQAEAERLAAELKAREEAAPVEPVVIIDPLGVAREQLNAGNYRPFYTELNRAIWKALATRLTLRSSDMNKHNALQELHQQGWEDAQLHLLDHTLSECEMQLYTPDHSALDSHRILADARRILDLLQGV